MPGTYPPTFWLLVNLVLWQLLPYLPPAVVCSFDSGITPGLAGGEKDVLEVLASRFGTVSTTENTKAIDQPCAPQSLSSSTLVPDSRRPLKTKRPTSEEERVDGRSPVSSVAENYPRTSKSKDPQVFVIQQGESSTNMRQPQSSFKQRSNKRKSYPSLRWLSKKRRLDREPIKNVGEEQVEPSWHPRKVQSLRTQEPIPDLNIPLEEIDAISAQAEKISSSKDNAPISAQTESVHKKSDENTLRTMIRGKVYKLLASSHPPPRDNIVRVSDDGTLRTASLENNDLERDDLSDYYSFRMEEVPKQVRSNSNERARAIDQVGAAFGESAIKNCKLVTANDKFLAELASKWPSAFEASTKPLSPDASSLLTGARSSEISLSIKAALYKINVIHHAFKPTLYSGDDGLKEAQREAFGSFKAFWETILINKSSSIPSRSTDDSLSVQGQLRKGSATNAQPLNRNHALGLEFLFGQLPERPNPHPAYRNLLVWALVNEWMDQKGDELRNLIKHARYGKGRRFLHYIDDRLLSSATGFKFKAERAEFSDQLTTFKMRRNYILKNPGLNEKIVEPKGPKRRGRKPKYLSEFLT